MAPDAGRPALARAFTRFNNWVALPLGVLVLALAEFSRYAVVWEPLRPFLAPRTLLAATTLTIVVWSVLGFAARQHRWRPADLWWLGVPVALALWSLLGLLWSPASDARTYLAEFWLYGMATVLLLGRVAQPIKNRWWLAGAAFTGAAVVILIALVEKITDTHLPLSNLHNPFREQWAVTSVFINQNHLAASLAIFLPLLVGAALSHRRLRWPLLVLAAGGLVALFFTGSTLAWLGLLLSAIVFGVLKLIYATRIKRKVRLGIVVAIAGAALLVGGWFALPTSLTDRFSVAAEGVSKSIVERTTLVKVGWGLALEHPLRGLGPAAAEPAVVAAGETRVQNLHSLVLEVAVNFGLPALLLLVLWAGSLAVRLVRWLPQLLVADHEFNRAVAVVAGIAGLLVIQAVPSTFAGVRAPWILLGLAVALVRDHAHNHISARAHA